MSEKIKIGIVTWVHNGVPNYGQTLQAYAMQQLLIQLDCEPVTLNCRWKDNKDSVRYYFGNNALNSLYECVHNFDGNKELMLRSLRFDRFISKYICTTKQCYNMSQVKENLKNCQVLLSGSDQIWNPYLYEPLYYLTFGIKGQKRVSYAPSLAVNSDNGRESIFKTIGDHLNKFSQVSVREQTSVKLLSKYTNKKITCVLDPTLLLNVESWKQLIHKRICKDSYIFVFIFGSIDPYRKKIQSIQKQYQSKKVISIPLLKNNLKAASQDEEFSACSNASPQDFLSLLFYADAVITNSFHAANFSIQFKKDFYIVSRKDKSSFLGDDNRLPQFLESMGLENRDSCLEDEIVKREIDYNIVYEKLYVLRADSWNYLKEAVLL